MYFTPSAGGQQTTNSPRRSSGGGASGSTSPIRKQFSQYMSIFQQDPSQGRQTPSDKIRKHHQHHFRSSSSNPANRMDSGAGMMLYGSSSVTGGSGSVTSLSPFHTPSSAGINNLVAVGTKTKSLSLLIDRSGGGLSGAGPEINYNYKRGSLDPRFASSVSGSYNREPSLERNPNKPREYFTMGSRWDRASADREYSFPFSGQARSLEREQQMRAQSFEGSAFYRDQETPSPAFFANESAIPSRDSYVLDLQAQIAELNKECAVLQQELDLAKEKLNSTMNSIKSFWSPELKKERSLRKEENLKYSALCEQLKEVEIENRQHLTALMKLEQENRSMREAGSSNATQNTQTVQQQQQTPSSSSTFAAHSTGTGVGDSGVHQPSTEMLKKEREKHLKEMKLMRKTLEEMELRIETQQKTLGTRDETIKKLMDMFQQARAKGAFSGESSTSNEDPPAVKKLESDLGSAREDLKKLREEAEGRMQQLESLRSQEKLLKDKLEAQKQELNRKDSETNSLQSRVDALQRHWNDHEKHISVLREQISSKEQQIKMLHSDVEMLQERLKEREEAMEKKVRQITHLQNDKTRLNLEMSGLRDSLDDANAKVTSQQRKLESLEEVVKEKELQLNSAKIQLSSLQVDHTSSDKALASLQDMLADKDRQIEKLKEQREKVQKEMEADVKATVDRSAELRSKVAQLQDEIMALQENELTSREEIGRLKAELGTKDALLSKLSFEENEQQAVIEDLRCKLKKTREEVFEASERSQSETDGRLGAAREEVETSRQEVSRALMELERMAASKSELESQLKEKTTRLSELEEHVLTLRRGHDGVDEGRLSSKGENRRSEEDVAVFKSILGEKDNRIEELESALKESIKITAQREVVMAEQQMKLEHTERLMESVQEELEHTKKSLDESREQLFRSSEQVKEKDDMLKEHLNDSKKQLSEVYEMKQEAILAAISEKDAHIALLEMAPNKRTENILEVDKLSKEKLKLQQVLRELTQSRMKLLQSRGHMRSSSASSLLHYATHRDADDDGLP